ncbi:MAG: PHP domain-containing protein [Nitrososphaeria archaeon]
MNDIDLFSLFLEMSCFSRDEAYEISRHFESYNGSMTEFVKEYLLNKCKTIFLSSTLLKFSMAYDDLNIRNKVKSALSVLNDHKFIRGDLHIHTNWSDGNNSIEEMAEKAKQLGYDYISITDHSLVNKGKIEMNEKKFIKQIEKIDEIQKFHKVRIIRGIEIDINDNGSLDYTSKVIEMADLVIGSIHFDYGKGETKTIELLTELLNNEQIDIIGHPLNKINKNSFLKNLDKIMSLAEKNTKILEINLSPDRIEESNFLVKYINSSNIMFSFGTDSHTEKQMELINLSNLWIDEIRKEKILNTYEDPLKVLLKKRYKIS